MRLKIFVFLEMMLLTETHTTNQHYDGEFKIEGYELIRCNSKSKAAAHRVNGNFRGNSGIRGNSAEVTGISVDMYGIFTEVFLILFL